MRLLPLVAFAYVGAVPAAALAQDIQGFEPRSFEGSNGLTLPYRLFKVKNPVAGAKYPLILFLHGAGERGSDNAAQLQANAGATVWASDANQAKHAAYIVAPQCPADQQWVDTPWHDGSYSTDSVPVSDELSTALEIASSVATELGTDPDRQYITGLSMGGYGTWDALIRNPTRFAAAIPICGGGDPSKVDLIKDLPLWTAHGDDDTTVLPQSTLDMVTALRALGSTIHYDPLPGVGHDAWTPTYAKQEIIDWLFTFKRDEVAVGGAGGTGNAGGTGGAGGMGGAGHGGTEGEQAGAGGGAGSNSASAGSSSGASAGSAGTSTSSAGSSSGGSQPTSMPEAMTDDGGCSYEPARPSSSAGFWLLGSFLALSLARRKACRA